MSLRMENTHRSNHCIFLPQNYGSPFNDTAEHVSGLGLGRIRQCKYLNNILK
jgi:hypothetical protein